MWTYDWPLYDNIHEKFENETINDVIENPKLLIRNCKIQTLIDEYRKKLC